MTKKEFISRLRKGLSRLSVAEIEESSVFYSEMIDDLIEEGISEENAIKRIGSPEEIAASIIKEKSLSTYIDNQAEKNKKRNGWQTFLIILGAPLWIPLLIAAFAVVFSVYAVIWSIVISLWAVEAPFFLFSYISKALIIACKAITKGSLYITKSAFKFTKSIFSSKRKQV